MNRSRSFRTGTEQETELGAHLSPEVKNTIRLTLGL